MATKKTFEELLNRLEIIVDEMESMDIGIEKAVKLYKEGIEISMQCSQKLENVEQQVKILKEKSDGTFKESNFKPMSEVWLWTLKII